MFLKILITLVGSFFMNKATINEIAITGEWTKEDWIDLYKTLRKFKKRVKRRRRLTKGKGGMNGLD